MKPLPPFPWDQLAPYAELARSHPGGAADLSVGTPTDPVPDVVREALGRASDRPGYPTAAGTPELREAMRAWSRRHCGVEGDFDVLPTVGSKEAVAALPTQLGLGAGSVVGIPPLAYPTYEVGARLAGARCVRTDSPGFASERRLRVLWLNYPANPSGAVSTAARLRRIVSWARSRGAVVLSDECYLTLGWERSQVSVLDPDVSGPDPTGVIAVHSLSKRSNLAGYRAGFLAGDSRLIEQLRQLRRHAGLLVPSPVQEAMRAALEDEKHAEEQRGRYSRRRQLLWPALQKAGFAVEHSRAGLYLWASRGESCWDSMRRLAEAGILAAPGEFYGPTGARHVRIALTGSDERVAQACERLAAMAESVPESRTG